MKDRIIKFLSHENLTATKFADEIGVQRSSISHILSGRNNPSFDFIQKILTRYKHLNSEWLILGQGQMFKKPEQSEIFVPDAKTQGQNTAIKQPDIFEQSTNNISPPEDKNFKQAEITTDIKSSRKIDKILVFYSDKTFDEFLPSK